MLHVIIAAAELECIPEEVAGHPQVRGVARAAGKRPTELLLDQNQHHQACKQLLDGKDRGRPDITHYTLLVLLESPLNKSGGLNVAVHTRHGDLLRIRSDTRLPRAEARFHGLVSKVLREGASQPKDPLIWREAGCTPPEALALVAPGKAVLRLDPAGPPLTLDALRAAAAKDLVVVIGGFAHGTFPQAWLEATPNTASLWPDELAAWAIAGDVAAALRPEAPATKP